MNHKVTYDINFDKINNLAYNLSNIDKKLTFEFNTNIFCFPSGISMLSSLINYKKEFIDISFSNKKNIRYLLRSNFFKNLDFFIEEDFTRHDVSLNMLECTIIKEDEDPFKIDNKLKKILSTHILDKENLKLGILLTTYEITDNILEHSTGGAFQQGNRKVSQPGFISAQYYEKYNHIEIGISDMGEGIVNTLEKAYSSLSRKEVLENAFKLNTTRHIKLMPTRGNGLAKLKEFVLISKGSIRCRTNEFTIVFNSDYPDGFIEEVSPVKGTHFEIIIGCDKDIDTRPIFNAHHEDYDEEIDDFLI